MPTVSMLNRQHVRTRARPRIAAAGNFITLRVFAQVYAIDFPAIPENYTRYKPYTFPSTKAIGYVDNPPPRFPLRRLVQAPSFEQQIYVPSGGVPAVSPGQLTPEPVSTPATPISGAPAAAPVTVTVEKPFSSGSQGKFIPGTLAKQLFDTSLPCRFVRLTAKDTNAAKIWFGVAVGVAVDNAIPIAPGASEVLAVDDASKVRLVAENATDSVFYLYGV